MREGWVGRRPAAQPWGKESLDPSAPTGLGECMICINHRTAAICSRLHPIAAWPNGLIAGLMGLSCASGHPIR
jgi:hypothetical protein